MSRTHTYTYALLEVSQTTYDEVAGKLKESYGHAFIEQGDGRVAINMNGLALILKPTPPCTISSIPLRLANDLRVSLDLTGCEVACLVCNGTMEIVDALGGEVTPHVSDGKYAPIQINHPDGTLSRNEIELVYRP